MKFRTPKTNALMREPSTGMIGQSMLSDSPTAVEPRRGNGQTPEEAVATTNRGVDQMSGEQPTNLYGTGTGNF